MNRVQKGPETLPNKEVILFFFYNKWFVKVAYLSENGDCQPQVDELLNIIEELYFLLIFYELCNYQNMGTCLTIV